jgi:threonine synthase
MSDTRVSGLQVPNVLDGDEVIRHCRMLGGNGYLVQDADVFECQRLLAQKEGIFCEPAAAVSLAGLMDAVRRNEINKNDKTVCLITGTGFKDMSSLESRFKLTGHRLLDDINSLTKTLNDL